MAKPSQKRGQGVDVLLLDEEEGGSGRSPEDELQEALTAIGEDGGASVKIEKIREGKRPEFVSELPASGFTLQQIQERFGGGEYICTILTGGRKYAGRRTVAIAAPIKAPASSAPLELSAIERVIAEMRQQAEKTNQLMLQLLMRGQSAPAGNLRRDLLEDMALMKQIMGGADGGAEKMLGAVKTGIEIAQSAAGGGESNIASIIEKAIEQIGPPLLELAAQSAAAKQPPAHRGPPAPVPGSGAPAVFSPGVPGVLPAPDDALQQIEGAGAMVGLTWWIDFLVQKAADNANPELYAELVLDNVPAVMVRKFFAEEADPVAALARLDSRIAAHQDWFRSLGEAVQDMIAADAAGSPALPADHGAPRNNSGGS